jgi:hypothetical protein
MIDLQKQRAKDVKAMTAIDAVYRLRLRSRFHFCSTILRTLMSPSLFQSWLFILTLHSPTPYIQ